MANFLTFSDVEQECAGCGRSVRPGLIGLTDEIEPAPMAPVCPYCLDGLDPRLCGAQRIVAEAGRALLAGRAADVR